MLDIYIKYFCTMVYIYIYIYKPSMLFSVGINIMRCKNDTKR